MFRILHSIYYLREPGTKGQIYAFCYANEFLNILEDIDFTSQWTGKLSSNIKQSLRSL